MFPMAERSLLMTLRENLCFIPLSVVTAMLLAGCSVHESRSQDGEQKDVDIHSPFGSISVHEGNANAGDIGLPVYPGAHPAKGRNEDDHNNANVNISGPLVGVKVVVQKFETDDSPDKVLAFYQAPMGKYGNVIQCSGGYRGGFHRSLKDAPVSCDGLGLGTEKELKAGRENDQHVVAVKPQGKGSEFTLVYIRAREGGDGTI
jgi:hypothetical protein